MRVELSVGLIEAVPGQAFVLTVDVTNSGDVIDAYAATLVGLDPAWVHVEPAPLSLFPGDRGSIAFVVTLPLAFAAGERPLGVQVASEVDPTDVAVAEFSIVVAEQFAATLRLDPQAATVGSRASFSVILENTGNTDAVLFLTGDDPERGLSFAFDSPRLHALAGRTTSTSVRVRGKRPFFGTPAIRSLTIKADDHTHELTTAGTIVQRPWIPRASLALGALLIALGAWAFLLTSGVSRVVKHSDAASIKAAKDVVDAATSASGGGSGGVTGGVSIEGSAVGLSGAAVTAFGATDPTKPLSSTTSDKAGVYQLDGLKAGDYRLRFNAPGFKELWFPDAGSFSAAKVVTLVAGTAARNIDVAMRGLPGSITGTVSGASNLAGIQVVLLSAKTALPGPAGATTENASGPAVVATVVAPPTTAAAGPAVFGAIPSGAQVTVTDGTGLFRFDNVATPGAYLIQVNATGFSAQSLGVTLGAGEAKVTPQVALNPKLGSISGVVSSIIGPIAGATITVTEGSTNLTATSLSTPVPGFYTVAGLPVPGAYQLTYSKPGFENATRLVTLVPGAPPESIDVSLTLTAGALSGVVVGTGDRPLPGATVTATSADGKITLTTTAAVEPAGAYTIGNLTAGGYTVTYAAPGYATTALGVTVVAGQPLTRSVALVGDGAVGGIVTSCDGTPAPGVTVTAMLNGVTAGTDQTTSTGAFLVKGLVTPNIYKIVFPADPGPSGFLVVVLGAAQQRTDVNWPTGACSGQTTTSSTSTTVTAATSTSAPGSTAAGP